VIAIARDDNSMIACSGVKVAVQRRYNLVLADLARLASVGHTQFEGFLYGVTSYRANQVRAIVATDGRSVGMRRLRTSLGRDIPGTEECIQWTVELKELDGCRMARSRSESSIPCD
jgi:hypothetical protein